MVHHLQLEEVLQSEARMVAKQKKIVQSNRAGIPQTGAGVCTADTLTVLMTPNYGTQTGARRTCDQLETRI